MITLEVIKIRMSKLKNWAIEGNAIVKDEMFPDFKSALEYVNKIGEISEKMNHHPSIHLDYNHVHLNLTTHSEKGLSEKDFDLAEEIDKI